MAKNQDERIQLNDIDDIEIFGAHKTREQIKAEEKARKQAEREALRREIEARRQAQKQGDAPRRFDTWTVVIALAFIVVLGVVAVVNTILQTAENEKFMRDETRPGWVASSIEDNAAEELVGVATEAYYSKGGYLIVCLRITNQAPTSQVFEAVEVTIVNGEEQVVASVLAPIPEVIEIPAQGEYTYQLPIRPDLIQIKDDPLTSAVIYVDATPDSTTN
ncbi:MAG: hypothetical protein IJN76_01705 [Clostridia bacterium]|nr:hypothetical protein [Clostridia bacterium]